jgi:hypothetical protein
LTLLALLGVLAVGVWGAFAVLAATAPAAPTITSSPANPTTAMTATFGYSESAVNTTFACALDGAAKTCAGANGAGKTTGSVLFASLPEGPHTFSITATVSGKTSSATSFTWTVDGSAPTATISFPATNGLYNLAGYNAGCAAAGICGTAADPSGVQSVSVAVQGPNGKYLSAGSFSSTTEVFNTATGTTSWKLALPASSGGEGSYIVGVHTTDTLGNTQPPSGVPGGGGPTFGFYAATATYRIDLTAPPAPSITSGPNAGSAVASSSAPFSFVSNDSGPGADTFLCKLDSGAYAACSSPAMFSGLADGSHTMWVEAKDAAGNISVTAASRTWTVDTTGPPKPTILGPNNKSNSTSATFTMTDSESPITYKCSLDGSPYTSCTNPVTYNLISSGTHVFDAEPIDQLGNVGIYNEWKWTINGLSGSGQPFTISSGTVPTLYPGGAADTLDLSLTNPNSVTIYVTNLTSALAITSSHAGPNPCTSADFDLSHFQFSGGYPIALGAGQTKTLSQLGYSSSQLPKISMVDRHDAHPGDHSGNQDACQSAALHFTYTGTAQS